MIVLVRRPVRLLSTDLSLYLGSFGGLFGLLLSRGKDKLQFSSLDLPRPTHICQSLGLCLECVFIRSPNRLSVVRFYFLYICPLLRLNFPASLRRLELLGSRSHLWMVEGGVVVPRACSLSP